MLMLRSSLMAYQLPQRTIQPRETQKLQCPRRVMPRRHSPKRLDCHPNEKRPGRLMPTRGVCVSRVRGTASATEVVTAQAPEEVELNQVQENVADFFVNRILQDNHVLWLNQDAF